MRRRDREVEDLGRITEILESCRTIRLGISDGERPYVVPVSFGMDTTAELPVLYFHCARQGRMIDLLGDGKAVFVEADTFFGVQKTDIGITTRFESIMADGLCERVTDAAEVKKGLELLLAHYGYHDYPLDRCRGLRNMFLYRIALTGITGKQNLPE